MNKGVSKRQAVNMVMPVETVRRLDEYAAKMDLSRTSAVVVLINQALDQSESINVLADLLKAYSAQETKNDAALLT